MAKYNNVRQLYPLTIIERFVCALTYLTFMFVGLVWLILCHITKKRMPPIVEYHIYQSFLLSVILYVISLICEISFGFMAGLPFIGAYVKKFLIYTAGTPIYFSFTLVHFVIFIVIAYLAFFAFLGKYSYLPYISDMVKSNLRIG